MAFPFAKRSQTQCVTALHADHLSYPTSVQMCGNDYSTEYGLQLLISMLLYPFFPSGNYNCPPTHLILKTYSERDENQSDEAQVQTYRHELQEKAFGEHNESKNACRSFWDGLEEPKK